jgi:hypothetical protein
MAYHLSRTYTLLCDLTYSAYVYYIHKLGQAVEAHGPQPISYTGWEGKPMHDPVSHWPKPASSVGRLGQWTVSTVACPMPFVVANCYCTWADRRPAGDGGLEQLYYRRRATSCGSLADAIPVSAEKGPTPAVSQPTRGTTAWGLPPSSRVLSNGGSEPSRLFRNARSWGSGFPVRARSTFLSGVRRIGP